METQTNLMRAFAGECQAQQRYQMAASAAREQGLAVIARAFEMTYAQEHTHARLFYELLGDLDGGNVDLCGGYPVNLCKDVPQQLRWAVHNEGEEAERIYPAFAAAAQQEGQTRAAALFRAVAAIERTHAKRFDQIFKALEQGTLFTAEGEQAWLCTNCGHIHIARSAPAICPVCAHPQGFFLREDLFPFRLREG